MNDRPVRPRDAASLVILRPGRAGHEVLLGRRASRHRFMPNVFVFPGGRLDAGDCRVSITTDLRPEVARRLEQRCSPRKARGLAVAAARETLEETGLVFGTFDGGALSPRLAAFDYVARAITPPDSPIRFHARFFLAAAEEAGGRVRDSAELQDLHWVAIERALSMPLVDVTEFVLQEVARRLSGWKPPGVPFFHYRQGVARIRYE